jgi:hypothetical protein
MAITNYTDKEIQFKIVVHGPPFAGKSTTLHYLQSRLDASHVGELKTLKSGADTTLFFDFVPRDATLLEDFKIRFELFTVTGNVVFNAPRKLALRDADGVIFVVDSDWGKIGQDIQSFKNLEDTLKKLGTEVDELPIVLQYNKRDLPDAAPAGYLDFVLNNRKIRARTFATVAATGANVFAPLRALTRMLVQRFLEHNRQQPAGMQSRMLADQVCEGSPPL